MRYQLLRCADHGAEPGTQERAVEPPACGAAGTAGLQWLWGMVEMSLCQAEPDNAA